MAIDALTTSGINSLVNSYVQSENAKRVAPLKARQTRFNNLSSAYSRILNQIDTLKSSLSALKNQSNNSVFQSKSAKSSNESRIVASASSNANTGVYNLRVDQLAKNDSVLSVDKNSSDYSSITNPGEYEFKILTGDGSGGYFRSSVKVVLSNSDFSGGNITFSNLANKISQTVNNDLATINSNYVSGTFSGSGSFKFLFGSNEYTINYSSADYEQVIDSIVQQLNEITGISAEKVVSNGTFSLKVTSNVVSNFIQFKDDTGSLLSNLGISNSKEIAASQLINFSVFSPVSGKTQISISSKKTGYEFRFSEISDITTNGVLNEFGLNLGTSRPNFVQVDNGEDTAGFLYSTNQLNAKVKFNGIDVQRNSNEINDLITGVNLKLLSTSPSNESDVVLTITSNTNEIKSRIENFITKFNELYNYLRENSASTKDRRGLLLGDSNASSLLNLLNNFAVNSLQGFSSSVVNSLSKLGITFNVNSGLSIANESQLISSIENKIVEVENFFSSTNGFANQLFNAIDSYSGPNGYLKKAQNQLNSNITALNDSIKNSELRISKSAERLRLQYQRLQSQFAQLISNQSIFTGNIFNQQL
ncbi:MAG: flagellar filament capping protein FliD [Ignavibacterium sp.]|nr:flagellar filament capping protein FliD [Ignavibacterium sp.]MDW8375210.1 flagellar filament capping protein FliD [Ignavibacteriales bacterium]